MMPIALLMIEHRQIERMIPVLRDEARKARAGAVDVERIDALMDFVRTYADKCHHGKEEDILFAELRDKPMTHEQEAVMERLIEDHGTSRAETKLVVEAARRYRQAETGAHIDLAQALEALAELYPTHIATEDKEFFIPCMALFSKEEQARMLVQFQAFDRRLIHQLYRGRMDQMAGVEKKIGIRTKPGNEPGSKWACTVCDLVYDPLKGDPEHGIPPGTRFEDIPDDWMCPLCGAMKSAFKRL